MHFAKFGAVALSFLLVGAGCGAPGGSSTAGTAVGRGGGGGGCDNAYFPNAAGTTLTYATEFSGHNGSYILEVLERGSAALKLKYTFAVPSAGSGSLSFTQDITCDGGALRSLSYADIGSVMSGGRISSRTTRASGEIMPRNLAVGTTWDSSFDIEATITLPGSLGTRTVNSTITNESRVVGRERVTVAAGSYDAFKVESTLMTTSAAVAGVTIPPQTVESTAWFVEGIGMVKSTTANSSTELQSVER